MHSAALRAGLLAIVVGIAAPTSVAAKVADAGTWSKAPDMLSQHVGHTATLLLDGRVLVAGGSDLEGTATAESEIFDPKTNRWTRAASMNVARAYHTATLLKNGDVLVVGGQSSSSAFPYMVTASAEIYQPGQNRWITVRSARVARTRHDAFRLRDGRVLIAGGSLFLTGDLIVPDLEPVPPQDRAEIYDPNTPVDPNHDPWSAAGHGMPDVDDAAFTLMPDGKVLETGGDAGGVGTASAELFDPTGNVWTSTIWPFRTPRYGHTATLLPNDKVLLVGGYASQDAGPSSGVLFSIRQPLLWSAIFDLRGNNADPTAYSAIPRIEHTATLLKDGMVLLVGSALVSNADSQLLDPSNSENWISTGMPMDRYLHTATLLADGRVLIAGGFGVGSQQTAWIYTPVGIATPSTTGGPVIELAVVVLLIGIALGFLATSRRMRWPVSRPTDESEWIEP